MSEPSARRAYTKPWLSISDQLDKLASRGLIVNDRTKAEQFLWHLNYYRFSGYCLAFEESRHSFRSGTSFEQVEKAYRFDVALRDLLTEALEVIEVNSRSVIAHIFGEKCGAFGHKDAGNFRPSFDHGQWLSQVRDEAQRSRELFVDHFRRNYTEFPDLPCWIATEVMSFGALSQMYSGLRDQCQKPIANRFNHQKNDFASVLHHLSHVRNVCAHHSRVWDRLWAITFRLPQSSYWRPPLVPDPKRVFPTLLIIYRFLTRCSACQVFATEWRRRVNDLMKALPPSANSLSAMGMPAEWYKHPYWV